MAGREGATSGKWGGRIGRMLPASAGFESTRYLAKWLILGTVIGIVAGLGAILFTYAIEGATRLLLGDIAGYLPPGTIGEGSPEIMEIGRPWLLPVVTTLGGLISGLIVFTFAPDAEGHGTDAAIEAVHHKRGRIPLRTPPVKLIASAITIGSGGSGGREGPAAQISAGFGSFLGRWLKLDAQDRRIAVTAGMGAGIGSIFRAPLGGAVMSAEILYIHDLEIEALIPALIASITGYTIYGLEFGFTPIFGSHPGLALGAPVQLVYYAALGVICGLGGLLYAKVFYGVTGVFHRIHIPHAVKPAIGGFLVGMIGLAIPGALHTGYGWVQNSMTFNLLDLSIWVVILLPFVKILATSLSIGSGGSAGIFGPGMVIGGMFGASFWRLTHGWLPHMPSTPAPFVIIGMIALFGGIAHAPLAVMLMVAEMTGNLSLLAPAMVAVAISTALVGDHTIYKQQLPNRAHSPAHRVRFSFPLLSSLLVRDAMRRAGPTLPADAPLSEATELLEADPSGGVTIVDDSGQVVGALSRLMQQRSAPADRETATVGAVAEPVQPLRPDEPLDAALEHLTEDALGWAPVVDGTRLVGRLTTRDVVTSYKSMLTRGVRRASALAAGTSLFEIRLDRTSSLAGKQLCEVKLPSDTLVISITRDGETLFPRADTPLVAGDTMMVMTSPEHESALRRFFGEGDGDKQQGVQVEPIA